MYHKKSISTLSTIAIFVVIASSCKVATIPELPEPEPMPKAYSYESDSISIGSLNWREFFKDPYLISLIDTAIHNNLDLKRAAQRIKIARANYHIHQGALLPSLNTVISADVGSAVNENINGNSDVDERVSRTQNEYFFGFQSSWEADLWGKLRSRKEAAHARLLASEKGVHLITTSLVAEISRLYYELLALDNELEVVRKNINFQEVGLEVIKIQKMGGRATELAVQQFKAQLLSTRALEREKLLRIVSIENQINGLIGRYPEAIPRENDISEKDLPDEVTTGLPSSLLLHRPDIQQAELMLQAAKADLEAARAAFLPSLTLSPYIGFNALKASALFQTPESLAIGVLGGLTAPVFNKKRIRSEYNRKVAERAEAYYAYQQTLITGFGEVVTNLNRIRNLQQIYELKEEEVNVLQNAVSTSNDLFTSGYATYLEVITAQERVLNAELELADIKKSIFHAVVDLYKSLGGGWNWNE